MNGSMRVLVMSLLLVTSVIGGMWTPQQSSPVQNAQAQSAGDIACHGIGLFSILVPDCNTFYGEIDTTGDSAEESQLAVYSFAANINDTRVTKAKETRTHSNQTVGLANAEAKYAIIRALNNGSTRSEAKLSATSAVNEFYSEQQKALIVAENRQAVTLKDMDAQVNTTDGLNVSTAFNFKLGGDLEPIESTGLEFNTGQVTLYDGERVNVTSAKLHYTGYDGATSTTLQHYGNESREWSANYARNGGKLVAKNPLDGSRVEAMNSSQYGDAHDRLDSNRKNALNNAGQLTDDIYSQYSAGDLSVSDVKSPAEIVRTSSTDYESTGGYGYSVAVASEMGYATSAASAFVVDYNASDAPSRELSGTLYADSGTFENDTINVGQTYQASNLSGTVVFVNQLDSKSEQVTLESGTFTVESMTDVTTGESINSTTLQSSTFTTTGTSSITEQIDQTTSQRNEIDETTSGGAGGSLIPEGRVIGNDVLALATLVLGIFYFIRRRDQ